MNFLFHYRRLLFAAFCFAFAKLLHVVELYINDLRSMVYVYSMLLFD